MEAKRISDKYGFSMEHSKDLVKEFIFLKKSEEEKMTAMRERRVKEERMKKLKQRLKEIKKNEFTIKEEEFEHVQNVINKKVKEEFFGLLKVTRGNSLGEKPLERKFQVYRVQSEGRMIDYLRDKFYRTNEALLGCTRGMMISITRVILNDGISVLDVFWEQDADLNSAQSLRKVSFDPDEISVRLERYSQKRIQFTMMREMGLKKPLQLRFYYSLDQQAEKTLSDSFKGELVSLAKEKIVAQCLEEERDPNSVTFEEFQSEVKRLERVLTFKLDEKINYRSLRVKYKDYTSSLEAGSEMVEGELVKQKKVRNNRNEDGSRKKTPKKDRVGNFWRSLK